MPVTLAVVVAAVVVADAVWALSRSQSKNASETLNTYAHLWPSDEDRITAAIDAGLRRDVHGMCTAGAAGTP